MTANYENVRNSACKEVKCSRKFGFFAAVIADNSLL